MAEVWFYHLTEATAGDALSRLIPPALSRGWRIEIRGSDPARMEQLDLALWLGPEEGFLPHGRAGGPHDALQPVLLTAGPQDSPARDCLMLIDGAAVTPADIAGFSRTCVIFDGGDGDQLSRARALWVQVTGAGIAAQYWAQEDGRWAKRQERPARGPQA